VPAGRATALDAEVFAIQLGVVKATSFDVKYIVIITDSLTAARRAVDAFVHSGQAYSLAIVYALRDSSLVTLIAPFISGTAQARPSGSFTSWHMKMLPAPRLLLDVI